MLRTRLFFLILAGVPLAGCSSSGPNNWTFDAPLILGRVDGLGINASATAPDQGATVSVGYRSAKVAIVPVTHGPVVLNGAGGDAFSTFSHFEASTGASPIAGSIGARACLGDSFATGVAAQIFAAKLKSICAP